MTKLNINESKQAFATLKSVKGSVQKVNNICKMISMMKVDAALLQLQFSQKRQSKDLFYLLKSAIANAENNHGLDIDNLYISKVEVGKAFVLRRFHARGRGRGSRIMKPYSRVTIYVGEKE